MIFLRLTYPINNGCYLQLKMLVIAVLFRIAFRETFLQPLVLYIVVSIYEKDFWPNLKIYKINVCSKHFE